MVSRVRLSLAVGRYAITMPLVDGTVQPDGIDVVPLVLRSPERHWRMLRHGEFDVSEVSIAGYLRSCEEDPGGLTAIPVFPHRRFRHGYIFVSDESLVGHPERLEGARIGLRTWGTSAGVWLRGILQDDHGVDLTSIRWITEHEEHVPGGQLDRFDITSADGRSLITMLLEGQIDALIYPERLQVPEDQQDQVHRLFPDPKRAEAEYFARSGHFPIMHTVAIRTAVAEAHPWIPTTLMTAFEAAKRQAFSNLRDPRWVPLAWGEHTLAEQDEILGEDPWPYGFEPNRDDLETVLRYAHEQGLTADLRPAESYFWPASLERPPVYRAAGHG